MKKMSKIKSRLLLQHPFFATLLISTPLVEDRTIETAYTDSRTIHYNPDFIDSLSDNVVMFVAVHEVMHNALEHGLRRHNRNPERWNSACDYAVNLMLKDCGFEVWDKCLIDEEYRGMTADQIYAKLTQQPRGPDGSGFVPKDGLGQDVRPAPNIGPEETARITQHVRQQVAQAATMARMAGKLTGGLKALVNSILNPVVPWQDILRDYMTRVSSDDESWSRRNRRFSQVYLPARYSLTMGEVAVIGDTSGSVSQEDLNRVAAEINSIAESVKPETIRVVWADTEVTREELFAPGDLIDLHPAGRGGTDMRVPLHHVAQFDPQVVVLITDGHTPWPAVEPDYPLIVCCTTMVDVPVGLVVRV